MREYIGWLDEDWNTVLDQSQEIVRCRDCRYYQPKEGAMLSCKFEYHGFTQWKLAKPDGFCAWGERLIADCNRD